MKSKRRQPKKCDHTQVVTTITAGIERVVCESCGYVQIGFDHRTCLAFPENSSDLREETASKLVGVIGS